MKILSVVVDAINATLEQNGLKATLAQNSIDLEITLGEFLALLEQADSSTTIDQVALDFIKSLTDDATTADRLAFDLSKSLTDAYTAVDAIALYAAKTVTDNGAASETNQKLFGKGINDFAGTSEQLITYVQKALFDALYATDDLDGESTVEDDQEIFFHKVRNDPSFASDVFYRVVQYVRAFSESASTGDTAVKTITKSLSDSVIVSELLDSQLIINRKPNESSGVTDVTTLLLGKSIADIAGLAESLVQVIGKPISDASSVSDLAALLLVRSFAESGTVSDIALKLTHKNLSDSGIMSDNGSYRGQGYCDFDYFLEDYVGYSGVF